MIKVQNAPPHLVQRIVEGKEVCLVSEMMRVS